MSLLSSFCSNSGAKVRKIFHIRKRIRKNLRIVTKKFTPYTFHIPQKRSTLRCPFRRLAVVLGVISSCADTPEITLHRALAARLILLREEVSLVGRHVHQVFRTGCDSSVLLIE